MSIKHSETVPGLKPASYQPTKAEMEEEFDMPGADDETLRKTFFTPLGKPAPIKSFKCYQGL
ncbi:MAG: hypothetical protein OXC63_13185 [Aestuariivita sp.]|nr:hypothetical protein [Aestuariivita sp.]MCY4348147.1 hypothetical protein [Aestuariivita sp.]